MMGVSILKKNTPIKKALTRKPVSA